MQPAKKPQTEEYYQHQADSAAEPRATVAIVSIVSAAAAEKQHYEKYDQYCAHFNISW